MQLDWAMIAEAVQVREGLAYVLGGGIDTVTAAELPARLTASVLVRLHLHRTEADRQHLIEARVLDEDGQQLAQLHGHAQPRLPDDLPIGWDVPLMMNFPIHNLQLARAGRYSIEILGDGLHLKSLNFRVQLVSPVRPA
ncbi:MAG: hypothetical protein E6I84_15415 [Chloroflexi bacterium]|nr:MAG: hypothetical protein E6I84_15415 [Chloroflexota bacterium]